MQNLRDEDHAPEIRSEGRRMQAVALSGRPGPKSVVLRRSNAD
jgi:hypothetical protein